MGREQYGRNTTTTQRKYWGELVFNTPTEGAVATLLKSTILL